MKRKGFAILLTILLIGLVSYIQEKPKKAEGITVVSSAGAEKTDMEPETDVEVAHVTIITEAPPAETVEKNAGTAESISVKDVIPDDQKQEAPSEQISAEEEPGQSALVVETPSVPVGEEEHTHTWVDEVVAYHDAVTHTVHHEAVTEQHWIPVIHETVYFVCDTCGARFATQQEAYAHEDATMEEAIEANDMTLFHPGHTSLIERTEDGYYETVILQEAYDEVIVDQPAWEEHIFRCPVCGATA